MASLHALQAGASSHTSSGAPSTPSTEVASKAQSNTEATASINRSAALRLPAP